jgi:hypothetical protein
MSAPDVTPRPRDARPDIALRAVAAAALASDRLDDEPVRRAELRRLMLAGERLTARRVA